MFVIVARLLPTRAATSSWVSEKSSMSCWYAAASSSGFSSSRWTFSTIACCSIEASSAIRTIAGIVWSPTRRARAPAALARDQLEAVAARARTSTGWSTPTSRIDSASAASDSSSKCSRGCCGFGRIDAIGISCKPICVVRDDARRDQRTETSTQPSGSCHGSPPSPARGRRRLRETSSRTR